MVDTELDHELLKRLLFAREVINISVAQIVCFTEETVLRALLVIRHDALRQGIKRHVIVADHSCPENMVVVPTAIKAYKPILDQLLNLVGCGIDHAIHAVLRSSEFPIHYKEIRKHFNVVKYNWRSVIMIKEEIRSLVMPNKRVPQCPEPVLLGELHISVTRLEVPATG